MPVIGRHDCRDNTISSTNIALRYDTVKKLFYRITWYLGGGDDCAFIWSYADTGDVLSVLPLKGHTDTVTSVSTVNCH